MKRCIEGMRRQLQNLVSTLVLVLLAYTIIGSDARQATASDATPTKKQRIRRTISYRDQLIEQLQLPNRPEITVIIQYKKTARKPMPVMLNWFGRRDRKIVQLSKELPAPKGRKLSGKLPPAAPC